MSRSSTGLSSGLSSTVLEIILDKSIIQGSALITNDLASMIDDDANVAKVEALGASGASGASGLRRAEGRIYAFPMVRKQGAELEQLAGFTYKLRGSHVDSWSGSQVQAQLLVHLRAEAVASMWDVADRQSLMQT
ncbi:hypothetical protein L1887_54007 [Cichorium endivia]|nr:hypothetical protein L1887_54007 [Cichorium endivia]